VLSHGYIKNDFSLSDWISPEFAEKALNSLIEEKKPELINLPQPDEQRPRTVG
jgi:hypothetical protein